MPTNRFGFYGDHSVLGHESSWAEFMFYGRRVRKGIFRSPWRPESTFTWSTRSNRSTDLDFLHRDVKPSNFAVVRTFYYFSSSNIRIFSFQGLERELKRDSGNWKLSLCWTSACVDNIWRYEGSFESRDRSPVSPEQWPYLSPICSLRKDHARRDDLCSLLYSMIELQTAVFRGAKRKSNRR